MTSPASGNQHGHHRHTGGQDTRAPHDPVPDTTLYRSERTRIFRRGAIVCKEPLGPDALERLRHETAILARLDGVAGVPQLAGPDAGAPPNTIACKEFGGVPLAQVLLHERLSMPAIAALGLALARIVDRVHARGVVHCDINPANILLSGQQRTPLLIDFHLALQLDDGAAQHRPRQPPQAIAGTLAYLSPEQAALSGRRVDHRADLYALGATLYELAAGHPPFSQADMLQLVHDHLARMPARPADVAPMVPAVLSDMIMRLLEKDPERRYQSAAGLAHDLARLQAALETAPAAMPAAVAPFPLGELDFPLRLAPPARVVGRSAELAALHGAFELAMRSPQHGLLLSGPAGAGKTALVEQLRPVAQARGGRFIATRYDLQREDRQADAFKLAFGVLGRLLLAGSDDELARLRAAVIPVLGQNAGLVAAQAPELATLLQTPPQAQPPSAEDMARLAQAAEDFLAAVVSPAQPLVLFIDDLQWAPPAALAMFDFLLGSPRLPGFLLAGAFREGELQDRIPAWERMDAAVVRVGNLDLDGSAQLLQTMLRMPAPQAAALAQALAGHAGGNPSDTVELVNAMRRDGVLALGEQGWHWQPAALQRYVGRGSVTDLLAARIGRLPPASRQLLAAMACLGGDMRRDLLAAATAQGQDDVDAQLAPLLDDGLLEPAPGAAVRLRHDRVQHAALPDAGSRARLHLDIARRLAPQPQWMAIAAAQYLPAAPLLDDSAERRAAIALLRTTAAQLRLGNDEAAERMLGAAQDLLAREAGSGAGPDAAYAADAALAIQLATGRHAALLQLHRFDEADALYGVITDHCSDAVALSISSVEQMISLMRRLRPDAALALGLHMLEKLGWDPDVPDAEGGIAGTLATVSAWIAAMRGADLQALPEMSDPRASAIAAILERATPAAYLTAPRQLAVFMLSSLRLWQSYGACAPLIGPMCMFGVLAIEQRGDYRLGHDLCKLAIDVSSARGYALQHARASAMYALSSSHWFEELDTGLAIARQSYERLVRSGDTQTACAANVAIITDTFECGATLAGTVHETRAALEFSERTGNALALPYFQQMDELARLLQGEHDALPEAAHPLNPAATTNRHVARAICGALMGDGELLAREAAAAQARLHTMRGVYSMAQAQLLHGLALARSAQQAPPSSPAIRAAALAELASIQAWLAQRAADAPANFSHMPPWLEAERAWAEGDYRQASAAYDAALLALETRSRPWQHALLAERAGEFQLAFGVKRTGMLLLDEARRRYRAWGAAPKVADMERRHPALGGMAGAAGTLSGAPGQTPSMANVSSDRLHMLALLRASQALSSETSLQRLQSRVAEQLGAMTGATQVLMFVPAGGGGWALAGCTMDGADGPAALLAEDAAASGMLPLSAFRYAERTQATLVVDDGARDDRFARDPYFADAAPCSVMVIPVQHQGATCAMLVLENRLRRGAFSAERLDTVQLIAGQLAVSLEQAKLYASLERKVAERTRELEQANRELAALSVMDALTGLPNRRRFDQVLQAEWLRAQRPGAPVGGAMIDVDQFKLYNDHYGHQQGDICLRAVAEALARSVRHGVDLAARYGGEEFAIILPGADLDETRIVAERARAAVEALQLPHTPSMHGVVTISVGIAAMAPQPGLAATALFAAADEALYGAKHGGRNKVGPLG